jgi:hypothetical protein
VVQVFIVPFGELAVVSTFSTVLNQPVGGFPQEKKPLFVKRWNTKSIAAFRLHDAESEQVTAQ